MFGKEIIFENLRFTQEHKSLVNAFNCGNEALNAYLKEEAHEDAKATTFLVIDTATQQVVCYHTLNCSGFVLHHTTGKITIYPAVEIKIFAIDEAYQHMPYSEDTEDGNLSDMLFANVISDIYYFTENFCGADKVILYSVPNAESFYTRNGFRRFENYVLRSDSLFIDDCIPMYLNLAE